MRGERWFSHARGLMDRGVGWAGLPGDAVPFLVSKLSNGERWLIVVDEPDQAERVARALRFFHDEPVRIEILPADDTRPYDGFSPSTQVVRQRLRALHRVEVGEPVVVVAPVQALLQRVATQDVRRKGTKVVRAGDRLDRDDLVRHLNDAGYLTAHHVEEPGFYAVRGDVLDVWPVGAKSPRRVDFFDDEVETVRELDPEHARSLGKVRHVLLLPAREERIDAPAIRRMQTELSRLVADQPGALTLRRRVLEDLESGTRFAGIEDWLPALVETVAPMDILGDLKRVVVHPDSVAASAREFLASAEQRWEDVEPDDRCIVPPRERYVALDEVMGRLADAQVVWEIQGDRAEHLGGEPAEGFGAKGTDLAPAAARIHKLLEGDVRVALVAPTVARADMLAEMFSLHNLHLDLGDSPWNVAPGQAAVLVGDLPRGFINAPAGWAFIPGGALFGGSRAAARRAQLHAFFDGSVESLSQLKEGDAVVHRTHGIGLYRGIQRVATNGVPQDYVRLEYKGGDAMLLPAARIAELSRYTPARSGAEVPLDRLGGATWAARKGKVRDALLARAAELLDLHARRELAVREPLPMPGPLYKAFEAAFPHEETPDQLRAIHEVMDDLSDDSPMDRLVCGDVGFGKTEIAMRAVMRAVEGGRQAAVLCPTTVLAYQHLLSFRRRFEGFPVRIEMLSRFSSASEEREIAEGLRTGTVDVVIGTTKLLGRNLRYQNLGLFVVDEEHRFGVRQKDRLKKIRTEADVLSMSATPIPRTLQLALAGAREMSLVTTAPAERLSVRTSIARFGRTRVRDAILQELGREGQAYFVHNRVETLGRMGELLREWVPEARFGLAHGQMDDDALERVLLSFMRREIDVLVCTSIVESGIDLPNVNTMLIDRADTFGMSQLYQLRGRVGRSNVRADCVLLVPDDVSRESTRRLRVIAENSRLGSGFAVAAADLELRGGGNLLGEEQSGHIDAVGYDVWCELLEEAVHRARGDVELARIEPEVDVPVPAFIPENLVTDLHDRLGWYQRLSSAPTVDAVERVVDDFQAEIGHLPDEVRNLAGLVQTRDLCRDLGIVRCSWLKVQVFLELHPSSKIPASRLDSFVTEHPQRVKLIRAPNDPVRLQVRFTPAEAKHPFRFLRWVMTQLGRSGS